MSKVISFRLNKDKPREALAINILEDWCSKGYSIRYVITETLLRLNDHGVELDMNNINQDLKTTLEQILRLLVQVENTLPQSLPEMLILHNPI